MEPATVTLSPCGTKYIVKLNNLLCKVYEINVTDLHPTTLKYINNHFSPVATVENEHDFVKTERWSTYVEETGKTYSTTYTDGQRRDWECYNNGWCLLDQPPVLDLYQKFTKSEEWMIKLGGLTLYHQPIVLEKCREIDF